MIEILPKSHGNILEIRATGKLTDQDYQEVLILTLEGIIQHQAGLASCATWTKTWRLRDGGHVVRHQIFSQA